MGVVLKSRVTEIISIFNFVFIFQITSSTQQIFFSEIVSMHNARIVKTNRLDIDDLK
jgi:hypothetical protein